MSSTITARPPRSLPVHPPLNVDPSRRASREVDSGWETLVELRDQVVAFLERRCRDRHQAEDLAHDTLLRAARYRTSLSRISRPRSWALQIAANVQRDHARRESRHRLTPPDHESFLEIPGTEPVPGESPPARQYEVGDRIVDGDDLAREVREVWDDLLPRDRVVLSAYYTEGGTARSAGEACGVGPDLAKVRLFRARRRLEIAIRARLGAS